MAMAQPKQQSRNGVVGELIQHINEGLWCSLLESLQDSPGTTQRLLLLLGRLDRPAFGAVTLQYREGRIVNIEIKETFQ